MKRSLLTLSLLVSGLVSSFLWDSLATAGEIVQLKNAREIYASYESVTGVDGSKQELRDLFKLNADRLPKTGAPEELSSSVVLAATELSGAFCKQVITNEKVVSHGQRILFGDVDFNKGPSQFNGILKPILIDHLAIEFWAREASAPEKQVLDRVINSASKGDDTPAMTEKVMLVVCTTYATSLAFLLK